MQRYRRWGRGGPLCQPGRWGFRTILWCWTWILSTLLALPASAEGPWRLATADTVLMLEAGESAPRLTTLSSTTAGWNWIRTPIAEPLMKTVLIGGEEQPVTWTFAGAEVDSSEGVKVALSYRCERPALTLQSVWRARPGRGPVEHWLTIQNRTGAPVTVTHQDSLSLLDLQVGEVKAGDSPFPAREGGRGVRSAAGRSGGPLPRPLPAAERGDPPVAFSNSSMRDGEEVQVWYVRRGGGNASTQGGTYTEAVTDSFERDLVSNCEDGASFVPWLALQAGNHGLYVGWEFSGLGRIRIAGAGQPVSLSVQVGNLPDFRTEVPAGAVFAVPPAFVGCYAGDVDEGSYTLHRFVLDHLRPRVPKDLPDPTLAYNLYLDVGGQTARESDVLRSAATCRDLGFETFVPDAMWYAQIGDWRWDPQRFPRGVRPIAEYVHRHGMKLGLWCCWTHGGAADHPGALSVRGPHGHPDWFRGPVPPDWQPGPISGAQLCLGSDAAQEWCLRETARLVTEFQLDYLKHDMGPIINSCGQATHRHRCGTDVSYWSTLGYYQVQEALHRRFPRLLLEGCSGGGHIKDFGYIQRVHYIVTTDTLSALPDRQSLYDSTFALPPLVLQAYTYENYYNRTSDRPSPHFWRSAMMGAWQIDPTNSGSWTEPERESARLAITTYQRWIRPMLRDVKVYHILPRPDGVHWDGLQHWSPSLRRGTLFLFRPDSPASVQRIYPRGLEPATQYRVWSEDGGVRAQVLTGAELMEHGLLVRLLQRYTSDLVYLQEAAAPEPPHPGRFALSGPPDGATDVPLKVRLSWQPSPRAWKYRVVVQEIGESANNANRREFSALIRGNSRRLAERNPQSAIRNPQSRSATQEFTVRGTSVLLPALRGRTSYVWRVQASTGYASAWNDSGPRRFTTQESSYLSDRPWASWTAGAENTPRRDENYYGQPISIGGQRFDKGVWTHSFDDGRPADLVVDLASLPYQKFAAEVGIDDAAHGGSVQFQILLDGVVAAQSPIQRCGDRPYPLEVDLQGAKQLTLRVLNGGDGYTCDHAAWGAAQFLATGPRKR